MFDTPLRALKDRLLAPWLRHVSPAVRPDLVTVVAFVVGVAAAGAAWQRRYGIALALWLVNRVIDGADGTLARVQGTQTDFGGYLDILLDFVVYALIPIGLVAGAPAPTTLLAALALLASFYVNAASWMYLGAIIERRRAERPLGAAGSSRAAPRVTSPSPMATTVAMPPGLVGGAETIVLYAAFLADPAHAVIWFAVMTALVVVTIAQRLLWARRQLTGPA